MSDKLSWLENQLNGLQQDDLTISAEFLADDDSVLKVIITDRDEFPIVISVDDEQILCSSYLWHEREIKPEQRSQLLEAMLTLNLPMPLSSFGKVGDQYMIFGAMSTETNIEDIQQEIMVLSENTISAVDALQDFLQ